MQYIKKCSPSFVAREMQNKITKTLHSLDYIYPAIPLSELYKRNEHICLQKAVFIVAKPRAVQIYINKEMDNKLVYSYNGVFNNKKEATTDYTRTWINS